MSTHAHKHMNTHTRVLLSTHEQTLHEDAAIITDDVKAMRTVYENTEAKLKEQVRESVFVNISQRLLGCCPVLLVFKKKRMLLFTKKGVSF